MSSTTGALCIPVFEQSKLLGRVVHLAIGTTEGMAIYYLSRATQNIYRRGVYIKLALASEA